MEGQVLFPKLGQQRGLQHGQNDDASQNDKRYHSHHHHWPPFNTKYYTAISTLQHTNHWRIPGRQILVAQKCQAERRRDREGDKERDEDRPDIGHAQWREETASQSRKGQDREKDQDHRKGGVNDGTSDFDRSRQHHPPHSSWVWCGAVFAQATVDILHVNHRIIYHLTDSNGEPSQRQGIHALTRVNQHDHGAEK